MLCVISEEIMMDLTSHFLDTLMGLTSTRIRIIFRREPSVCDLLSHQRCTQKIFCATHIAHEKFSTKLSGIWDCFSKSNVNTSLRRTSATINVDILFNNVALYFRGYIVKKSDVFSSPMMSNGVKWFQEARMSSENLLNILHSFAQR